MSKGRLNNLLLLQAEKAAIYYSATAVILSIPMMEWDFIHAHVQY